MAERSRGSPAPLARQLKLGFATAACVVTVARGQGPDVASLLVAGGQKFNDIMAQNTDLGSTLTEAEVNAFNARFIERAAKVAIRNRALPDDPLLEGIFFDEQPVVTQKKIDTVSIAPVNWTAGLKSWSANLSLRSAKLLLGYIHDPDLPNATGATAQAVVQEANTPGDGVFMNNPELNVQTDPEALVGSEVSAASSLPEAFNAQEQWPHCSETIGHLRNQGQCGSGWAQAAAGSMDGRLCIASKGEFAGALAWTSAGYITSCYNMKAGPFILNGCDGGNPGWALQAARKQAKALTWSTATGGIPTGSESSDTCVPYLGFGDALPQLEGSTGHAPACPSTCTSPAHYQRPLADDLFYPSGAPVQTRSLVIAKRALMEGGPIPLGFDVYDDFMFYGSGYYDRISAEKLGGHAVTMIGWKLAGGVDYVVAINSWGEDWGEGGFFKMNSGCCNLNYFIPSVEDSDAQSLPLPNQASNTPAPVVSTVGVANSQEPEGAASDTSATDETLAEAEKIPRWYWYTAAGVCSFATLATWCCLCGPCCRSSPSRYKKRSYSRMDAAPAAYLQPPTSERSESKLDEERPLAAAEPEMFADAPEPAFPRLNDSMSAASVAAPPSESFLMRSMAPAGSGGFGSTPPASSGGFGLDPANALLGMMPVQVPQVQVRQAVLGGTPYMMR